MDSGAVKLAGGALLLIVIWVAVFWLWEPRQAPISSMEEPALPQSKLTGEATPVPRGPEGGRPPGDDGGAGGVARGQAGGGPDSSQGAGGAGKAGEGASGPSGSGSPGGGSGPKTRVIPPEFEEYVVQPGDSFASIARRFFGSGAKATIIANANPFKNPLNLRPGETLKIPKDPNNIQGREVTTPREGSGGGSGGDTSAGTRTYTVKAGDTLGEISDEMYGTSRYADVILKANRSLLKKPEDLRPGMTLTIPPTPR